MKRTAGLAIVVGLALQAGTIRAGTLENVSNAGTASFAELLQPGAFSARLRGMNAPEAPRAVTPRAAAPTRLTADDGTGLILIRQMKAAKYYVDERCRGDDACIALELQETGAFTAFSATFQNSVPASYSVDADLGDAAHNLAEAACGETGTASDGYPLQVLRGLAQAENLALVYLKEIQIAAGRTGNDVKSCKF